MDGSLGVPVKHLSAEHIDDFARLEETVAEIVFREEFFRLWECHGNKNFIYCGLDPHLVRTYEGYMVRGGRRDLGWIAKVLAHQAVERMRRGESDADDIWFACDPTLQIGDDECRWFVVIWNRLEAGA